jgi:hypothetical protein
MTLQIGRSPWLLSLSFLGLTDTTGKRFLWNVLFFATAETMTVVASLNLSFYPHVVKARLMVRDIFREPETRVFCVACSRPLPLRHA